MNLFWVESYKILIMYNLDLAATLPILLIIGLFSSTMASMIGLGGGLIAIPLIMLAIGFDHSEQAKLISYVSVTVLSIVAVFKYIRQKQKPDLKTSFFMLLGIVPTSVVCVLFLGTIVSNEVPKYVFSFLYGGIIIAVILLINFKDKIPFSGVVPVWTIPLFGVFVGFLAGTFGLSGGVIFIPFLLIGLKMSPKSVAVNSLLLKLVTSLVGVITGLASDKYQTFESHGVFWWSPLAIIGGAIIGSQIGPIFNKKMTNKQIMISMNIVLSLICLWEFVSASLMALAIF